MVAVAVEVEADHGWPKTKMHQRAAMLYQPQQHHRHQTRQAHAHQHELRRLEAQLSLNQPLEADWDQRVP